MAILPWDDLRILLAVHAARSHSGAGKQLGVAATTVGRRVAALERESGARLFTRTPEGLVPTAAGRALLLRAERIQTEVVEAQRELLGADERPTGSVRITCGEGFAYFVLCPALPAFLESHPGLTVEVCGDIRTLDLTRGEADLALRMYRPREGSLVARRLGLERYGLFASPAYLARRRPPRSARDLAALDLLLLDRELDRWRQQAFLRHQAGGARVAARVNGTTGLHAACAAGAGVALLPTRYVRDDPRFVPVLPGLPVPPCEIWAVTHSDLRGAARVTAALAWVEVLVRGGSRALPERGRS